MSRAVCQWHACTSLLSERYCVCQANMFLLTNHYSALNTIQPHCFKSKASILLNILSQFFLKCTFFLQQKLKTCNPPSLFHCSHTQTHILLSLTRHFWRQVRTLLTLQTHSVPLKAISFFALAKLSSARRIPAKSPRTQQRTKTLFPRYSNASF